MKKGRKPKVWKVHGLTVQASTVRDYVFRRDGGCLAVTAERELQIPEEERHVCGSAFRPTSGGGLTFEHVVGVHGHLDVRRNDEKHGVALCSTLNGESMMLAGHDMKDFFREYLRDLYPDCPGG